MCVFNIIFAHWFQALFNILRQYQVQFYSDVIILKIRHGKEYYSIPKGSRKIQSKYPLNSNAFSTLVSEQWSKGHGPSQIRDDPQVPDHRSLEIKDLENRNPILTHGWENRFGLESDIKSDIFIYWMRDKA